MSSAVHRTDLPGLLHRGKVRDLYRAGDRLMIVATDRISAFDVVMDQPVPGKGVLLTQMSRYWLETLPACRPHHLDYVVSRDRTPPGFEQAADVLAGRAMVVQRADILPIECIVRGCIVGSGWKEYQATGTVSGVRLPAGLRKSERLAEPIFTPSTKATVGHDEAVSFDQAVAIVAQHLARRGVTAKGAHGAIAQHTPGATAKGAPGAAGAVPDAAEPVPDARELMQRVRRRSIDIYNQAAAHAERCGLILADTKFEFGLHEGELLLADEVLTPDSSRFWPRDQYEVGRDQPSFDKQYLRDYLETIGWNKQPPPPPLPAEVVDRTREKYEDAYRRLTT